MRKLRPEAGNLARVKDEERGAGAAVAALWDDAVNATIEKRDLTATR